VVQTSEPTTIQTTGVVLAGGQSIRMGRSKAALEIAGKPLLQRVVGRLQRALPVVLVIGPAELAPLIPGVRLLPDLRPGLGPLGGLETALSAIDTPCAFVVACDMPFVVPTLVRYLATVAEADVDADVIALRTAHGLEHLHAVYRAACLPEVRTQLDSGTRSVHALLQRLRVRAVDSVETVPFDPRSLSSFNANTPHEWRWARALDATEVPST
jgi:molybdopterin-guanine dinucleotide biosynthesis protein A